MLTSEWPYARQISDLFLRVRITLLIENRGGLFGWLYDMIGQRGDWFALYANDGKIDDETYCNEVKRGNFRLHPKVGRGISKGCITIDRQSDFNLIRAMLKGAPNKGIPGSVLTAYGKVAVR